MLRKGGLYAFTTNEIFFNDLTPGSIRNVTEIIDKSGLDILYKATQLSHIFEKGDVCFISENCGLITASKGDFDSLPDSQNAIESVRKRLEKYSPDMEIVEGQGSVDEFKAPLGQNQTNLVLVKTGQGGYHWFNTPGNYREAFTRLASQDSGFYPELFTAIN